MCFHKSRIFLYLYLNNSAPQATQFTTSKPMNWSQSLSHALIYSSTFEADMVFSSSNTSKGPLIGVWASDVLAKWFRGMRTVCVLTVTPAFQLSARPRLHHLATNSFNLISMHSFSHNTSSAETWHPFVFIFQSLISLFFSPNRGNFSLLSQAAAQC